MEVGDNMKKVVLIAVLFVATSLFVAQQTYSYYFRRMKVNVSSTGSNGLWPNAGISSVVVKNSESNSVTAEPFTYTLTFENETGSDAIFGYNNEFSQDLSVTGSLANDQARTNSHIIQVKSNSGLSETINYKVNLNCVQQN